MGELPKVLLRCWVRKMCCFVAPGTGLRRAQQVVILGSMSGRVAPEGVPVFRQQKMAKRALPRRVVAVVAARLTRWRGRCSYRAHVPGSSCDLAITCSSSSVV